MTANSTSFTNLRVFVFTPCTTTIGNLTSGLPGQIIAGTVNITNNYTMNYFPFPTPGGGGVTGFTQGVVYLREVQNP